MATQYQSVFVPAIVFVASLASACARANSCGGHQSACEIRLANGSNVKVYVLQQRLMGRLEGTLFGQDPTVQGTLIRYSTDCVSRYIGMHDFAVDIVGLTEDHTVFELRRRAEGTFSGSIEQSAETSCGPYGLYLAAGAIEKLGIRLRDKLVW